MLYDLAMINGRTGHRVVLAPKPVARACCRRLAAQMPAHAETEESEAMESYEILNDEACGAVRLGQIECAAGCGGATLKMDGHAPDAVLFYANVAEALAAVRLYYGYANAYLNKVREVAA